MKKLTIIIVNYNVKHYLTQCLNAIWASQGIELEALEVFVVDNDSTDGSVSHLKQAFPADRYPNFHIIANRRNVGFGRANNQALRKAKGEYILYLNPDTMLTEHTLADALTFAEAHADTLGAIGAMMLNDNGSFARESRRGLPTPWVALCKMSGLTKLFPHSKRFGHYYMGYLPKNETSEIDIISGAFMLARADILKEMGGFDEEFFMYGEDIDLSYRFLKLGRKNYYLPTPMLHYKGESAHRNSFRYVHVFYEAMLIFFNKHFRHYGMALSLPIKAAILLQALASLTKKSAQGFKKYFLPRTCFKTQRYLYLGHHQEVMELIAEQYSVQVTCETANERSLPKGHLDPRFDTSRQTYDYVVYDLADFSRATILSTFAAAPSSTCIGTLDAAQKLIITAKETMLAY